MIRATISRTSYSTLDFGRGGSGRGTIGAGNAVVAEAADPVASATEPLLLLMPCMASASLPSDEEPLSVGETPLADTAMPSKPKRAGSRNFFFIKNLAGSAGESPTASATTAVDPEGSALTEIPSIYEEQEIPS